MEEGLELEGTLWEKGLMDEDAEEENEDMVEIMPWALRAGSPRE
jgi:hypothetical protein